MDDHNIAPVSRNSKFYSEDEFDFEMDIVDEYVEEDTNQTVVLYRVDPSSMLVDGVYGDAVRNVRYLAPVEIPCLYEVQEAKIDTYDKSSRRGVFTVSGNLKVYVSVRTLEKYGVDICRGDYMGVLVEEDRMYYWCVTNDGRVNTANMMHVGAYKPGFRIIDAAPVASGEFNGM